MKRYKVYWTKEAANDLEEIIDYISKERVSAAKSIYKKIKSACRELNTFPGRYRRVPELLDIYIERYREIIIPPYRVIYKLTESNVYIIAVIDGRRDFESFENIPDILKEEVFIKGFEIAEIANFDERQMAEYEESLKVYRDLKAVVDTSIEEGFEDGKIEVAKKMKSKGYPLEEIIDLTGLAKEVIEKL
jgi:toxin ParE1/3/4